MSETQQIRKVTPEEHKKMVEHGIKLRKDGIFAFNLKCPECGKANENNCFGTDELEDAVLEANAKTGYLCDTLCWLEHDDDSFRDMVQSTDLENDICLFLNLPMRHGDVPEEDNEDWYLDVPTGGYIRIRDEDPALWQRIVDLVQQNEDFEPHDLEVECEVQ